MNILKIIIGTNTKGYSLDKDQIVAIFLFIPPSLYSVLSLKSYDYVVVPEAFRGIIDRSNAQFKVLL